MKETIIAIALSLLASFIYDTIKTFFRHKPTIDDSREYSKKYLRDVKLEFFISFPLGILFAFLPIEVSDSTAFYIKVLSFFMFFVSLMAFVCLVEMINNLTDDDSTNNVS